MCVGAVVVSPAVHPRLLLTRSRTPRHHRNHDIEARYYADGEDAYAMRKRLNPWSDDRFPAIEDILEGDAKLLAAALAAIGKVDSDAGNWSGPAFEPMTAAELLEHALRAFEQSEEEWTQADIQVGLWKDQRAGT